MFRVEVLVLFFGLCVLTTGWSRRWQSSGAYGTLTCNGKPAKNVLVKLYDADTFSEDDKMAETRTDSSGRFRLTGKAKEWSTINPILNIYHDCNNKFSCQRMFTIKIDSQYVNEGEKATKLFPVGALQLQDYNY